MYRHPNSADPPAEGNVRLNSIPRRRLLRTGLLAPVVGLAFAFFPPLRGHRVETPELDALGCAAPTGDCHAHCYCNCGSQKWDCWALFYDDCFDEYFVSYPCCKHLACGPCDGRFLWDCTPCGCAYCQQFNCA